MIVMMVSQIWRPYNYLVGNKISPIHCMVL